MAQMPNHYDDPVKQDGLSDSVRTAMGSILAAAAVASAAYNASQAYSIAQDEWKLAKKYWKLAENWLNYYKDYYAPVEDQELKEARALKSEQPEYGVARGRMRAASWAQFKGLMHKAVRCTSRYCTGKRQDILETVMAAQADSLALCDALGYRNERAYIEARDDVRFKRQLETAKRGRDMIADTVSFGRATAGIYGELWGQAWEGLKGAGGYLGYVANRRPIQPPVVSLTGEGASQSGAPVGSAVWQAGEAVGLATAQEG